MNKVLWLCWFDGWATAPWVVRKCLASWQVQNAGWDVRALDRDTLQRYVELPDLTGRQITAASMSDIVRVSLLHEYGGVWVDATTLCHRPLDDWLPDVLGEGFFAFDRPARDRVLASWFIAAAEGNELVDRWHAAVLNYWQTRERADRYFWFHNLFGELCTSEPAMAAAWDRVPKISAVGPHAMQYLGLLQEDERAVAQVMSSPPPVSKLTYRVDLSRLTERTLLWKLLAPLPAPNLPLPVAKTDPSAGRPRVASLTVSTNNLGDHLQVIASSRLLQRTTYGPTVFVDRDDEVGSTPNLDPVDGPYPIILNGWFKRNRDEWPPSPALDPVFVGFHIRPFQCPELLSEAAIDYYRTHGPIGCRDPYTFDLLSDRGVDCLLTNCLTITFPRRTWTEDGRDKVFVVSRDKAILSILPPQFHDAIFVSHYVPSFEFADNIKAARDLLDTYSFQARLVITTMLHCALPAIAMGIPVVVFYPQNPSDAHASDVERFSALDGLVPIHHFDEAAPVDWAPESVPVAAVKLALVDSFHRLTSRWQLPLCDRLPRLAPSSALPPP